MKENKEVRFGQVINKDKGPMFVLLWKPRTDHRIRDIKAENNSSFRQGAGNKLKLWGIWRANCAVKNFDCAGNCAGLRNVVTKKRSLLSQENDNFASISDKIKNASYRSSNHTEVFATP